MRLINRTLCLLSLMLVGVCLPLMTAGAAEPSMTETQIRENWGRVMYCQRAYKVPDNKQRVYEYDLQQCDTANTRMQEQASLHGEDRVKVIHELAKQRAMAIGYNTISATSVIGACRESCQKLAGGAEGGP
jgi:hypothetical protein